MQRAPTPSSPVLPTTHTDPALRVQFPGTATAWAEATVFRLFPDNLYFYPVTFREVSQASSRCPAVPSGEAGRVSQPPPLALPDTAHLRGSKAQSRPPTPGLGPEPSEPTHDGFWIPSRAEGQRGILRLYL